MTDGSISSKNSEPNAVPVVGTLGAHAEKSPRCAAEIILSLMTYLLTFHVVHFGGYALAGSRSRFRRCEVVGRVGLINVNDLGIWYDVQAERFKPLIAFMKRQGTAIGIQIGHGGRKASSQSAMQGILWRTEERIGKPEPGLGSRSGRPPNGSVNVG